MKTTVYFITTDGTIEKTHSEDMGVALNSTSKICQYLKLLRPPDCDVEVITPMRES